jgi:hypothetical protein
MRLSSPEKGMLSPTTGVPGLTSGASGPVVGALSPDAGALKAVMGFKSPACGVLKPKKFMKKQILRLLIPLILAAIPTAKMRAQHAEPPRLVVLITIDQLRGDCLKYFAGSFGDRGFKRLLNAGMVYHRLDFGFPNLSKSAAAATISTGTFPEYHGIMADKTFDFETLTEKSVIADEDFMGNFTQARVSPRALLAPTVGDRLKIASDGRSSVYSIAPDANQAILTAGRLADAAYWIDNTTGRWATTTYFRNLPWYVDHRNAQTADFTSRDLVWTPEKPNPAAFPCTDSENDFRHVFRIGAQNRYIDLKATPFINSEVTGLASEFLRYADLGKRPCPDMLLLTYNAGDRNPEQNVCGFSPELADIYIRLDKEIERLIDLIEKSPGLNKTLVILTSNGYSNFPPMPTPGEEMARRFIPERCLALLNLYLMALFGESDWVMGYYDKQIYMNRKRIEERGIDFDDITTKAAAFVSRFAGIQEALVISRSGVGRQNLPLPIRRGIFPRQSGDVLINLQPLWTVSENLDESKSKISAQTELIPTPITAPVIFFGSVVKHKNIFRTLTATEIASSISFLTRIRKPDACVDRVAEEFLEE